MTTRTRDQKIAVLFATLVAIVMTYLAVFVAEDHVSALGIDLATVGGLLAAPDLLVKGGGLAVLDLLFIRTYLRLNRRSQQLSAAGQHDLVLHRATQIKGRVDYLQTLLEKTRWALPVSFVAVMAARAAYGGTPRSAPATESTLTLITMAVAVTILVPLILCDAAWMVSWIQSSSARYVRVRSRQDRAPIVPSQAWALGLTLVSALVTICMGGR